MCSCWTFDEIHQHTNFVYGLQVHAGWVLDTDVFNEWMNEEDYCVDERNVPIILRRRIHLREDQVCVKPSGGLVMGKVFSIINT